MLVVNTLRPERSKHPSASRSASKLRTAVGYTVYRLFQLSGKVSPFA